MIEMLCNLPKMVKETKAQADAIKTHLNSRLSVAVVRNINKLQIIERALFVSPTSCSVNKSRYGQFSLSGPPGHIVKLVSAYNRKKMSPLPPGDPPVILIIKVDGVVCVNIANDTSVDVDYLNGIELIGTRIEVEAYNRDWTFTYMVN